MNEQKTNLQQHFLGGLTNKQVLDSRLLHGNNELTPPASIPLWKLYLEKYKDPIIQILLIAAFVSLGLAFVENNYAETLGIFVAIFLATTVGFYFERDAAKKFNILNTLNEEQLVKVRRNGKVLEILRKEVVVGDVIILETGDEIPADARLIKATDMMVDESTLTGEPICSKYVDDKTNKKIAERTYPHDIILRSTMVMNGHGVAVVTAVGDDTEIGKVAQKSTEFIKTKTPLNKQLDKLATLISKVGLTVAVATFVIFMVHDILVNTAVWQGGQYLKMAEVVLKYFMMSVTLIVVVVPEGLPMAVTLSLALNMRRMLKGNNLVRKLHACETMGAVTVICTDKTGTLTQNRMTVMQIQGEQTIVDLHENDLLAYAIALNTTAELNDENGIGNPTEVALLRWLQEKGVDYKPIRNEAKIIAQQPFSTEQKYMATVVMVQQQKYLFVKGAPEVVMNFCKMTEDKIQTYKTKLLDYQNKAMRTLAFAYKPICEEEIKEEGIITMLHSLTWQAITAISDPIRKDVPHAIQQCKEAGIEVKIVTGDVAATAIEIARGIGVWNKDTSPKAVITGTEWNQLTDEEAYQRAKVLKVMARARPSDKQRLVEILKKQGEVVAVTGDGTNDAPALHHANVGLSLGSGTSVAKEASDMTLLDDSFGSIAHAVMWGRSLYKNIQRFLFFQLTVNVTALLLVLGSSFIGIEIPLTVTQMLWVNLLMDTFAAMALASLPPSNEVMREKPRRQTDFILDVNLRKGILFCGIAFFVVMFVLLLWYERIWKGELGVHELTIFFTVFVMIQLWNLFNAKTLGTVHSAFHSLLKDRGLLLVLLLVMLGQWLIVTFGGKMFRTVALTFKEWISIIVLTSVVLWIGEMWRWIKRMQAK